MPFCEETWVVYCHLILALITQLSESLLQLDALAYRAIKCLPFVMRHACDLLKVVDCSDRFLLSAAQRREPPQPQCFINTLQKTSSQAPSYVSESETMNRSLTHLLTGVKCRATSVAKNLATCFFN